jgi:solute carrier family 25 carnitine/acylcarnitine transporter 20/29
MGDPVREDELFQRAQRDKILLETNASRAAMINYMAGVGGGVAVVLFGHPFDTTKTRMQTAPPGYYKNTWDAVKQTVKFEGIRGFYTGMMSPMYGQMFFRAISFMTFYTSLRAISTLSSEDVDDVPSVRSTILAGAVTGLAISAVEAPIDVVKTKLQIQVCMCILMHFNSCYEVHGYGYLG